MTISVNQPALWQWQRRALDVWLPNRRGVASVVTGAGKTRFAMACIESLRASEAFQVLVLVPTIALLDQWIVAFKTNAAFAQEVITAHGGGSRVLGEASIHVMTMATAVRASKSLLSEGDWFVVGDECHRLGAATFRAGLPNRALATLGLSATPVREFDSGFEDAVAPSLGPIFFEYSYVEALRDGVIAPFELRNYEINLGPDERKRYDSLTARIARATTDGIPGDDPAVLTLMRRRASVTRRARNRIPAAVAIAKELQPRRTLLFHESIEDAQQIASLLRRAGLRAGLYHSGLGVATRQRALYEFRLGLLDILVTCRALDEGIDVPAVEAGVIASSTSSTRQRIQRIGRIIRRKESDAIAIVCTIFATDAERTRLMAEAADVEGGSRWFRIATK